VAGKEQVQGIRIATPGTLEQLERRISRRVRL
jgi:hypothetical protein